MFRGPHRARPRAPTIEPLEARSLLSAGPQLRPGISFSTPAAYFSEQVTSIPVTIQISLQNGRRPTTDPPLTLHVTATLGHTDAYGRTLAEPASAASAFTPVDETITVPPGTTSETVRIPVNPGADTPAVVPIDISVTSSLGERATPQTIYLESGTLPPQPALTSARMLVRGAQGAGFVLTFNQPMDPATVQDKANYLVETTFKPTAADYAGWLLDSFQAPPSVTWKAIGMKSATYDPATNTVTLLSSRPLKTTAPYTIMNGRPLAKHQLKSAQGIPLQYVTSTHGVTTHGPNQAGGFDIRLRGTAPATLSG
jgi:hypothetical protein